MLSELDLIKRYFDQRRTEDAQIALGIGDDCAILTPRPVFNWRFLAICWYRGAIFPDADPVGLGHKCLAVNLSDLAAMGAKPLAFTLVFSLPKPIQLGLRALQKDSFAIADQHQCKLIGGDTTKGPLNICITIFGELPNGLALRRDAAQVGDDI